MKTDMQTIIDNLKNQIETVDYTQDDNVYEFEYDFELFGRKFSVNGYAEAKDFDSCSGDYVTPGADWFNSLSVEITDCYELDSDGKAEETNLKLGALIEKHYNN